MSVIDLDAFEATPVSNDPFPHVIVRHFVKGEAFDRAIADYPKIKQGGSFPVFTQKPGPGLRALLDAIDGDDSAKPWRGSSVSISPADPP